MSLENLFDKAKHELKALLGEESKDKFFPEENTFSDAATAKANFPAAKKRLFNIPRWKAESGVLTEFELYDQNVEKTTTEPQVGYYMKVTLPGILLENWVKITDLKDTETVLEFTVHPCANPQNYKPETQHFFVSEASSTVRIELDGNKILAAEIGKNETINNHDEAGNRSAINTLIAESGWNGLQKIQWGNLAAYWCGKKDAEKTE